MNPAAISSSETNWQSELTKSALKYHLIVCWVAIALNPLWGIGDYFNIPAYWKIFFVIRCSVAFLTLLGYFFRKKIGTEILAFIPFLGISLQNAYMYSVMDVAEFQKHTFAYIALFIGAGMLVLWKPLYSFVVVSVSIVANLIAFALFSPLSLEQILINGGLLTATVALFTILLIQTRYNLTKKEIISRLALAESNQQLAHQKEIIEEKNKEITDSINYAKGIQQSILPSVNELKTIFPESFIFFRPKDIVSGDFFWFEKKGNDFLIAAADCTGHGVPGALMSMIGSSFLHAIVNEKNILQPDEILFHLRERIIYTLRKKDEGARSAKDGMDIALVRFMNYKDVKTIQFAGAFNPLLIIRNGEFLELEGNKFPVGLFVNDELENFTMRELEIQKGDSIYLFTDGYADQFGGEKGKKFMYKKFKELLLSNQNKTMSEQEKVLSETMKKWRGKNEQTDDMLVMGIKVGS